MLGCVERVCCERRDDTDGDDEGLNNNGRGKKCTRKADSDAKSRRPECEEDEIRRVFVFIDVEGDETEEGEEHERYLNADGRGEHLLSAWTEEKRDCNDGCEEELCGDYAEDLTDETAQCGGEK